MPRFAFDRVKNDKKRVIWDFSQKFFWTKISAVFGENFSLISASL
jgi:hypothetical protein